MSGNEELPFSLIARRREDRRAVVRIGHIKSLGVSANISLHSRGRDGKRGAVSSCEFRVSSRKAKKIPSLCSHARRSAPGVSDLDGKSMPLTRHLPTCERHAVGTREEEHGADEGHLRLRRATMFGRHKKVRSRSGTRSSSDDACNKQKWRRPCDTTRIGKANIDKTVLILSGHDPASSVPRPREHVQSAKRRRCVRRCRESVRYQ